jgi:hypothetical protein
MTPVTEGFYASPEFLSFGFKDKLRPVSTAIVSSPYFGASQGSERTAAMDKAYEDFKARTTGGVKPVLTAAIAKDLIYRSSTTGAPTAEFNLYGGLSTVKAAAAAAGLDTTTKDIQNYEIQNNLPESASTKFNKQFIGPGGAVLLDQLETDLNSSNPAIAQKARDSLNAQQKAAEQQVIAERQATAAATTAKATTAGTTATTGATTATTTGGGLLSVPTETGTTATTGTTAATGARTGAVTLPTAAELKTMSQGSVLPVKATPVTPPVRDARADEAAFTAAGKAKNDADQIRQAYLPVTPPVENPRADEAAFTAAGKAKNDADQIRQAYLSVLGRVPDAAGYKYFSDRFGTDVDAAELEIFRTMAAPELAARTTAGTTATTGATTTGAIAGTGTTAATTGTTTGTTAAGMSIIQAYQQVLGRTPNAQEIAYWTTQFGPTVDAKELSSFSVAAQPELAAVPTTNNAVRQMYLSVLGREPDATGLKYFSDRFGADVDATELGIFRGMSTQEIAANTARNVETTAGTTTGAINRPTTPTQVTSSQLAPAVTGTGYSNIYQPANYQQNAPTLASIQAAAQSANPYQSLMAMSPQRSLSPSYAAQAGLTTANTNLGGYDSSLYSKPLTGLLAPSTVAGGTDLVNNSSGDYGGGNTGGIPGLNIDPLAVGMARVANLFSSGTQLNPAPITTGTFNLTDAGRAAANAATIAGFGVDAGDRDVGSARGGEGDGGGGARAGGEQGATGGGYMARGGMVTPRQVKGPNPPGPDDGYTGLDIGEYVIRKSAVKKYGSNIFEQINAGKIPAQRLKSLLE